jgi:hypothetical protein
MFRNIRARAGLELGGWAPRELRHVFVAMRDAGVRLEENAGLVGHGRTKVTKTVCRKRLRPVLTGGAQVMDTLLELPGDGASGAPMGALVTQLVPPAV